MPEPNDTSPDRYTLRIFRYDAADDAAPRFDDFDVAAAPGMTVLDALFRVQEQHDPSVTFRYACRGAVCGSCAMAINGRLDLACRVQLTNLPDTTVVLEPLPNLDVIRDLVVDMEPFWRAYEHVQPWLQAAVEPPEKETSVSPKDRDKVDQYVNCILCASCYGSCLVAGRDTDYLGPAALAKLARFTEDVRDGRGPDELAVVDSPEGAWGCDFLFRCRDACPKDVRPSDGVAAVRRRLVGSKMPWSRRGQSRKKGGKP